jgi:hypothetical protein
MLTPEREERIRKHPCRRKHILYPLDEEAFACFVCDLLEEIAELREIIKLLGS